jgi:hypothetical protein
MATAVAAAFIAFWDSSKDQAALFGGLAGASLLLVAAGFAAAAARPTSFDLAGNHPNKWFDDREGDLVDRIGRECESYQRRISYNEGVMGANKRLMTLAFLAGLLAPLGSVLVWLLLR